MTAQYQITQLPDVSAFHPDEVIFRPVLPPHSTREEVKLHVLAHEMVRHIPRFSRLLAQNGASKLQEELEIA